MGDDGSTSFLDFVTSHLGEVTRNDSSSIILKVDKKYNYQNLKDFEGRCASRVEGHDGTFGSQSITLVLHKRVISKRFGVICLNLPHIYIWTGPHYVRWPCIRWVQKRVQ